MVSGVRLGALGRGAARLLLDTVFPRFCPGCDRELPRWTWTCGSCRSSFSRRPPRIDCLTCRAGDPAGGSRHPLSARAAFYLGDPLDRFVHALKYGGRDDLCLPLGRLLGRRTPAPGDALVTWVPLHPVRRRERGYDQARLLAVAASRVWGLPVVGGVLLRNRPTAVQARLEPERRSANLAGAFSVPVPAAVRGRRWIVVDDVATTGATLSEALGALQEAGAGPVSGRMLALAGPADCSLVCGRGSLHRRTVLRATRGPAPVTDAVPPIRE